MPSMLFGRTLCSFWFRKRRRIHLVWHRVWSVRSSTTSSAPSLFPRSSMNIHSMRGFRQAYPYSSRSRSGSTLHSGHRLHAPRVLLNFLVLSASYFTFASGMKFHLDSFVESFLAGGASKLSAFLPTFCLTPVVATAITYLAAFGSVLVVALLNPQNLIKIVEIFASLTSNLAAGVFVCVMYKYSCSLSLSIAVPLDDSLRRLWMLSCAFLLFAVFYDAYVTLRLRGFVWLVILLAVASVARLPVVQELFKRLARGTRLDFWA
eukprot:m.359646 g.359646  ORF g.359646 m.359646 type:complete len:263 (+) comp55999_c0_seq1:917-1705(+)